MKYLKNIFTVLALLEMRFFLIYLPIAGSILVVEYYYEPFFLFVVMSCVIILFGCLIFISSLRLARLNLDVKLERNELKSIIINLRDGVIAYDENFKILVFNHAAEKIFSVKAENVLNKRFTPERADIDDGYKLLVQTMFPSLAPTVVSRTEPGVFPALVDISFSDPVREIHSVTDKIVDPAGNLLGFVKIISDKTREVEFLKSKSEFVTVAAHQLGTPLTAINWVLQIISKDTAITGESKEAIASGLGAAEKMSRIINDLLDVARIEDGRFGYDFRSLELIEFISGLLNEATVIAKNYGINIYLEKPQEQVMVYADPKKLAMVFSNLLDNAIKYNVANGSVTVKVAKVENQPFMEVSIADTGIGIPEKDITRLFAKFFRAENALRFETNGNGLGLFIVKNIIERHGGSIWAESVVDRGTTFHFTIPLDKSLVPPKELAHSEIL